MKRFFNIRYGKIQCKSRLLLIFLFAQITYSSSAQETCTALTSGNWSGGGSLATWFCTGSVTVPEELTGASTVIVPNGITLTIKTNVSWDASVIVENGGTIVFDNQLNLGDAIGCGYTLIIENGGNIIDSGTGANDRLYICGNTIISSAPNPPSPAVGWPAGGFDGPTGFNETGENSTLPVELTFFNAQINGEVINLFWSTASELNNDYFTLERSGNGKDFEIIGKVDGQGTTTSISAYSFTDHHPYLGLSYYRLSQTDYDGTTEIYPMISVLYVPENNQFIVSPNPVRNGAIHLKVTGKGKNERLVFTIFDLQGRLLEQKQLAADNYGNIHTETILDNNLRKGTYIFELASETNREYIKVVSE